MSIDELIKEKTVDKVIDSLETITHEFNNLTKPLKDLMNPDEKKKKEIFEKVRSLRLETEKLAKKMREGENKKDLRMIRKVTNRVKEIVKEKQELKKELMKLNLKNEII